MGCCSPPPNEQTAEGPREIWARLRGMLLQAAPFNRGSYPDLLSAKSQKVKCGTVFHLIKTQLDGRFRALGHGLGGAVAKAIKGKRQSPVGPAGAGRRQARGWRSPDPGLT